jgi:hypothetical protein
MEKLPIPLDQKFETPEQEIEFLRKHITERENSLAGQSPEVSRDTITTSVVREYAQVPEKDVLPSHKIMEEAHKDKVVLRLSPEAHDKKMEELLGILLDKGVRTALAILEKMNDPHLDDDFHRLLVQYIHTIGEPGGLKPETTLFKGLHMTLFEITIPDAGEDKNSFKTFITAMEQFYSGMQSIGADKDNSKHDYYTLEIALASNTNEVVFYAGIPNHKIDLFEKQVLAFYHDAKIKEISNDYNIFNENGTAAGAYVDLLNHEAIPIKTYDTIEHDPLSTILNAFSKLKKDGEGAAIQILIAPAGEKLLKKFNFILDKAKQGEKIKKGFDPHAVFDKRFLTTAKDIFFGPKEKDDKAKEGAGEIVERITAKIKSPLSEASIRIIASADNETRASLILSDLESAFNQFSEPNGNSITFKRVTKNTLKTFLHEFSYRMLPEENVIPFNFKELATLFHFPIGLDASPQLKQAKAGSGPAPLDMGTQGILLGTNTYRGVTTPIHMKPDDRMRHFYVIGQTGTGKTLTLKNMFIQDMQNGDGCCFIDPHGTDIQDILSYVPKERIDDVIYFDPAYIPRPMGLNMLDFDVRFPEQKSMVIDTLMSIFNQLFDMKAGGGAMFEQYFKNSALLVMEHPESGCTLLEITRVLADKAFRDMKLSHCDNPIIAQFWKGAEATTGDQGLENFVPYISSKFDGFISNEFMRPVVLQPESAFNFREIMDKKKILLVNLSKGRLGELNANLIGMIVVMKFQMAALSRVDSYGQKLEDFFLYIDEFQNVTTPAIASILSEARKYRLSLNIAHQYISQLPEDIKGAVFGNVGSMAVFRVSPEDAQYLESKFTPTFTAKDITRLDNMNAYMSMIINGAPSIKPFNIFIPFPPKGNKDIVPKLKELSYLTYGKDRATVEAEIMGRFKK